MARSYPDGKPRLYAKEKLGLLKRRKADAVIGPSTTRMAAVVFPGASADVFHGFTAFSMSPTEDTALAGNSFHEIGLYQVEAGPSSGPAPNKNPNLDHSNWAILAGSDSVKTMLSGRSATLESGKWKTALEDQIAVGLANLRYHADLMIQALAPQLQRHGFSVDDGEKIAGQVKPNAPGSNWDVMWAFTAFSRGEGQFFEALLPYLRDLADEPETTRWLTWRRLVATDIRDHKAGIGSRSGKNGAAYAIIRTEQKLQSGYLLATETAADASWFQCHYTESEDDLNLEDIITRMAYST